MAAEITLFKQYATAQYAQVPAFPFDSQTGSFTVSHKCVARVFANAAPVVLTQGGITWTVPSGTVEYFGFQAGDAVTVA